MSIRRIESAYAYYLDKKGMSGPQMSVLQALAYCANEKRNERCFPSDAYLARLTHLGDKTVERARKALRTMKAIDWVKGGRKGGINTSNHYAFLFPQTKMRPSDDGYETVTQTPPTLTLTPPQGHTDPNLPSERRSNTEINPEINSKSNAESCPTNIFDFKFEGIFTGGTDRMGDVFDPNNPRTSPQQAALKLCGVNDARNQKTFGTYMGILGMEKSWDIVLTLKSEVNQGEHKNAKNLAAILTKRLKAFCPPGTLS